MKRDEFEAMGDRHKRFEIRETERRLMPGLPTVARMDGRSFHTFTRGLPRPFDARLREAMVEAAKYLVAEMHANIAYTQSDEISLVWENPDPKTQLMFDGRVMKLCTILASTASVKFNQAMRELIPEKAHLLPVFDARVYQYPTLDLAAEAFVWREADATRNSLTMAAHAHYSHKELQGAGYRKKHEMLFAKGVNWADYPAAFKRGVYVRREAHLKTLTPSELARIPVARRPTGPVMRTSVRTVDMPPIHQVTNLLEVLYHGAPPEQAVAEVENSLAAMTLAAD